MNRKIAILLIAAAVLLAPTLLFAQEEITLESIAESLTALTGRVDSLEQKLTPGAIVNDDGNCRLALADRLHANSLVSFLEKYPDDDTPSSSTINNVYIVPGTGVAVTFEVRSSSQTRRITEYWSGCEFLHSSDWKAYDWLGNPISE